MSSNFSNAFNFDEAIQHNVDPRTGSYPVTFSLGDIVSHDFYGVQFSLKLRHDPLDLEDHGFGQTWSFLLTYYDKVNQKLYTSDGKQYDFDGSMLLKNYGVNDFKIDVDEENSTVDIVYRNGTRERFGTDEDINYMTTLFSADGKKLLFEYKMPDADDEKKHILSRVYDEFSSRSILIDYKAAGFVIVRHNKGDVTYLTYLCKFKNKMLNFVSLPNTTDYGTKIAYERMEIGAFISELAMPTGYHEWVTYEMGHTLPPEHPLPTTQLPYVSKVMSQNGEQQDNTVRTFTYSKDTNYLGLSGDKPWDSTYGDNIYTAPSEYTYYSVETINNLKIKRTYNKFHALIEECEYTEETSLNQTEYTYYCDVSKPVNEQPRNFLLLKKIFKKFFKKGTELYVGTTYSYEYDEEGNLLEFSDQRTLLRNEYYSAEEDPLRFVRLVKSTTRQPATGAGPAPITTTFSYVPHEYPAASGLLGEFPTLSKESTNSISKEYTYEWEDERTYGQLIKTVTTKDNQISNTETRTINVEENVITEKFKNVGFDEITEQRSIKYSLFTKLELETTGASGKVIQYSYNFLGRPIEIKTSISDEVFTSKVISYVFDNLENKVTVENSDGNKDVFIYNSKGNLYSIQRGNRGLEIESTFYDSSNNIRIKRITDYAEDGTLLYEIRYKYEYDLQGRQLTTKISPLSVTSDILIEEKVYDDYEMSSYVKVPGMDYKKQYYNLFGDIIKTEYYDVTDNLLRFEEYEYDAYARMIQFSSGALIKTYTYDEFDRVTSVYTNEGDSTTTYEYASFTTHDLMEKIFVDGKIVGSRKFDSLGRITSESMPSFAEKTYTYEGASHLPSTVIHGSNKISYINNNHLDKPLQATYADGKTCSLTYDTEGRIILAVNENITLEYKYNLYGFLYQQNMKTDDGERTARELFSVRGNPILRKNFLNTDIYYKYNRDYGLVSEIGDVNVKIEFTYDDIGRIISRNMKKITGDEISIECKYIYDEKLGRISSKETYINGENVYYDRYTYNEYGMINRITKVLPNFDSIIEEFAYDKNGRLINNKYAIGSQIPTETAYVFDNFDNILEKITTLPDTSHKITYVPKDGAPCAIEAIVEEGERHDLTYDVWGRVTTDMDGLQYQYDTFGRMVGAVNPAGEDLSSYTYDPFGVQFLQKAPDGSFCYSYYFNGMLLNCVTSDGSMSYFSDGNEIFYERRQLSDEITENYFITDYKGTVVAEISGSTVTQRYEFTVYGDLIQRAE